MKVFKSRPKNFLYFVYRMINPIFDPIRFFVGLKGYVWFIRDAFKLQSMDRNANIFSFNLYPKLEENTAFSSMDKHYFYHPIWVFEHILKKKPKEHVDIGSSYLFCGYLSKITRVTFVDIRPIKTSLKNLITKNGSVLNLPYKDDSINSLSCLHVVEHIGLGRYGDPLDPKGSEKACLELSRVLAKNGLLYFCVPTGKNKLFFNAHRVLSTNTVLSYFKNLKLVKFAIVDDEGNFKDNADPRKYDKLNYGCGMYIFTKN